MLRVGVLARIAMPLLRFSLPLRTKKTIHTATHHTDSGFTDMLRVGALARIAKPLLRFSLHAGDDSRDALAQLQAMLPEARGRDAELIK